jgi:hypothetical protein
VRISPGSSHKDLLQLFKHANRDGLVLDPLERELRSLDVVVNLRDRRGELVAIEEVSLEDVIE